MATSYRVRKTGSDSNGGTSNTVRSAGTDGLVTASGGASLVTSITAAWGASDVGHAINVAGRTRLITGVVAQQTLTCTSTNGNGSLTSAGLFNAAMVGTVVTGPGINTANTIITTFTDASHVTLSNNSGAGAGSGSFTFGAVITTTTQASEATFVQTSGQAWAVGGPWLTFAQALVTANQPIKAGDSVYFGAGTYREIVSVVSHSGSAGNPINVYGDYDGAITGDAGEIVLTAYLNTDFTNPSSSQTLALGSQSYLNFDHFTMIGTSGSTITNSGALHDVNFTDCTIVATASNAIAMSFTAAGANVTFDRCTIYSVFNGCFSLTLAGSATAIDANVMIKNSYLISMANAQAILLAGSGSAPHQGGVRCYDSTIFSGAVAFQVNGAAAGNVNCPHEIRRCLVILTANVSAVSATTLGTLIEDDNYFFAAAANPRTNVPVGKGTMTGPGGGNAYNGWAGLELGQSFKNFGVHRPWFGPSNPNSVIANVGRGQGEPITRIQDAQNLAAAGGTTNTVTLTTPVTPGNSLILCVTGNGAGAPVLSVSGCGGNWIPIKQDVNSSLIAEMWWNPNPTGGTSVLVTMTTTIGGAGTRCNVSEWKNLGGVDVAAAAQGSTQSAVGPTTRPVRRGSLIIYAATLNSAPLGGPYGGASDSILGNGGSSASKYGFFVQNDPALNFAQYWMTAAATWDIVQAAFFPKNVTTISGGAAAGAGGGIGGGINPYFMEQAAFGIPGLPGWRPGGLMNNLPQYEGTGAQPIISAYDWTNRPAPAGGFNNNRAAGAFEYHDTGATDSVLFDVTPASYKLRGAGDIEMVVPVDASSNTITVKCYIDPSYSGQQMPSVNLVAEGSIGVTAQTVYALPTFGAWQTITLAAFTPTVAGFVKLRLCSYDGGGLAQVNFDTFAVA